MKKDTNNQIVIEFVDNIKININLKNLELSFENMPEGIVHKSFTGCTTFFKLDEDKYNLFTTDREITFKNPQAENTFVLFAVKTTSGEYYLGCCNNGNSTVYNGLFSGSVHNSEIKMLYIGDCLNNIGSMFHGNEILENIVFTKNFKTNNVTNMSYMFSGCSSLNKLNLSNWNTSNVTNMRSMFSGCSSLNELDLSNWNTSNVTNMSYMFECCEKLEELNLSNFKTQNVTTMVEMFRGCTSLKVLNLSSFITKKENKKGIAVSKMFNGCDNLTIENCIVKDDRIKTQSNNLTSCKKKGKSKKE